MGFKTPEVTEKVSTIDEVFAFIEYWDKEREKLPFDIDGVVIKVNSFAQQTALEPLRNFLVGRYHTSLRQKEH